MKQRAKSSKGLRKYHDVEDKALNKEETKYVKQYMNYMMKKKYKDTNNEDFNSKEDWNTTRVRSLNVRGDPNKENELPGRLDTGHLDKKDYSLYYMDIDSQTPKSASGRSRASSKSMSLEKKRMQIHSRGYGSGNRKERSPNKHNTVSNVNNNTGLYNTFSNSNNNRNPNHVNRNINNNANNNNIIGNSSSINNKGVKPTQKLEIGSHMAFIKLIFNMIDKVLI